MYTLIGLIFLWVYLIPGLCVGFYWIKTNKQPKASDLIDYIEVIITFIVAILIWPLYLGVKIFYPRLEKWLTKKEEVE